MVEFIVILVLFCLVSAVLGIEIQESVLALKVKRLLYLNQPYQQHLLTLGKFKTWRRFLGTAFYALMPLCLVLVVLQRFHFFIAELLDCAVCSSFHITWILLYFIAGFQLGYAFLFAPLGILCVYIIQRLKN